MNTSEGIKARDVMTRSPLCVDENADLLEVAEILEENEISGAPVIDAHDRVVGVISKTDVIHHCMQGPLGTPPHSLTAFLGLARGTGCSLDPGDLGTASEAMTREPVTVTADQSIEDVASAMVDERVHRVVVVDDQGHARGIITTLDVLHLVKQRTIAVSH
jgi:CBS domain-containing protein